MFILFRRRLPSTSASPNLRSVRPFRCLQKHPGTRTARQQRIVFILCEKVSISGRGTCACVFMCSHVYLHETGYPMACCQFPCRPDEDICVHFVALNIFYALWTGCSSERLHYLKTGRQSVCLGQEGVQ